MVKRIVFALFVPLFGCGGGSFDTGGPASDVAILGTTNLQQINDYFVDTTVSFDGLACTNSACHAFGGGGGGFQFRDSLWANMTAEQQNEQQLIFESRVDFANLSQSAILLRATQPTHGGAQRYTSSDQIYLWIEEWLNSSPP